MGVPLLVDSRVRIPVDAVPAELVERVKGQLEFSNPEIGKRIMMGLSTWGFPAKVRCWRLEDGGATLSLPRGALGIAEEALRAAGVPHELVDRRVDGAPVEPRLCYVGPPPRAYQAGAVRACRAATQGFVRASTGSGKTLCSLMLAASLGVPTLVVLPNAKLLEQWLEVVATALGISGAEVGRIHGATRRLRPLTVATQQTLWSRKVDEELKAYFGCVIADEAHHHASRTGQRVFDAFPARYRFGFSADKKRKDRMEPLLHTVFGPVIHETSREECEAAGTIVDVEVRVVMTGFRCPSWERATAAEKDFNRLLDEMCADADRNARVARLAEQEARRGEQVLLLTHRREHARHLVRALRERGVAASPLLGGAGDAAEFEATIAGIRARRVAVGVGTYSAIGEGIDFPAVAVGIAATPIGTNEQRFGQVRGRLCRPGKEAARLWVVHDPWCFGRRVVKNIVAWNRTVRIFGRGAPAQDAREWLDGQKSVAQGG